MDAQKRRRYEVLLEDERARLTRILERLRASTLALAMNLPPGDDASVGSDGVAPFDDAALEAHTLAALRDADLALQLLREHPEQYGRCIVCGQLIPGPRMEVVPTTRHCETHAAAREAQVAQLEATQC
jgi:RNA polymerase-binding transcription factor DksA